MTKGETLYYQYYSRSEDYFHFEVVGGLKLPTDFYCDFVIEKKDKFIEEIVYTSELLQGVVLAKIKKGAGAKYFISFSTYRKEQNLGKKGVIILLENNKRIDKPEVAIEVTSDSSYGFRYSVTLELTLKDINLLIDSKMTDVRMGTIDFEVNNGIKLKGILDCLITK